jgi:hypothetical protein
MPRKKPLRENYIKYTPSRALMNTFKSSNTGVSGKKGESNKRKDSGGNVGWI